MWLAKREWNVFSWCFVITDIIVKTCTCCDRCTVSFIIICLNYKPRVWPFFDVEYTQQLVHKIGSKTIIPICRRYLIYNSTNFHHNLLLWQLHKNDHVRWSYWFKLQNVKLHFFSLYSKPTLKLWPHGWHSPGSARMHNSLYLHKIGDLINSSPS